MPPTPSRITIRAPAASLIGWPLLAGRDVISIMGRQGHRESKVTKLPQPSVWGPAQNSACCAATKSRPAVWREMLEFSLLEGPFTSFSYKTTRDCGQCESSPEKRPRYRARSSLPLPDHYSVVLVRSS